MSTHMGLPPTVPGGNEDLTIGKQVPNKPLPQPPANEEEMTEPKNFTLQKMPPVEESSEQVEQVDEFDSSQDVDISQTSQASPKKESTPTDDHLNNIPASSTRNSVGNAEGINLDQKSSSLLKSENPATLNSTPHKNEHLDFGLRNYTPTSSKESVSLSSALKSFSAFSAKIGKFLANVGTSIKTSAFGVAIKGAFAKREKESTTQAPNARDLVVSEDKNTIENRFRIIFKNPDRKEELRAYCENHYQMDTFNFIEKFVNYEENPTLEAAVEMRKRFLGDDTVEASEPINIENVQEVSNKLKEAILEQKQMDALSILSGCFTTLTKTLYQNMLISN